MQIGLKIKFGKNKKLADAGFTLIEIMISITVFALFATAYVTSEGFNISDSTTMREELFLQKLCENKINQILIKMPELKESLILVPMTGNFEAEGYPDFEYSVEFKKLKIPDLKKIQGEKSDEDKESGGSAIQDKVFDVIKKNMEEMVWQIRVTVQDKNRKFPFILSTFIRNDKAEIRVNF